MFVKLPQILALSLVVMLVSAAAQDNQTPKSPLQDFFKGMTVTLKIDMPGDYTGITLSPENGVVYDPALVANKISRFGASLREKDTSTVTRIVTGKNKIEFWLGKGGYYKGIIKKPAPPAPEKPSVEEIECERQYANASNPRTKDYYRKKCAKLRQEKLQRDAEKMRAYNAGLPEWEARTRLRCGSRFILQFTTIASESVTPDDLKKYLAAYIDFSPVTPDLVKKTSSDKPVQKPKCVLAGLFSGDWQNISGDTICVGKRSLTFGSGTVVKFQETFRLAADRIYVITTKRDYTGGGRFILVRIREKEMKLTFYKKLNDLKDEIDKKREETWTRQ